MGDDRAVWPFHFALDFCSAIEAPQTTHGLPRPYPAQARPNNGPHTLIIEAAHQGKCEVQVAATEVGSAN